MSGKTFEKGSLFIRHPSQISSRPKLRHTLTNPNYFDFPKLDQIPCDEKLPELKIDDEGDCKRNFTSVSACRQKWSEKSRKDKLFRKLLKTHNVKGRGDDLKEQIDKIEKTVDKLSNVISIKVSMRDSKTGNETRGLNPNEEMEQLEEKKLNETKKALFLIVLIVIYTFGSILLMDTHNSPKFQ